LFAIVNALGGATKRGLLLVDWGRLFCGDVTRGKPGKIEVLFRT
jgi:hypothetical protein